MSRINAIRFVNLNYNHNAMKVSDETFFLSGKDTLLALRNGGGKTVLVQMISSLFVHKRFRDMKDRTFESYFTTTEPTFIMTEWLLDGGAGKVLVGSMVRKNSRAQEEGESPLEIINFISAYADRSEADITNLPVISKTGKEVTIKSFPSVRRLFEGYRKNRHMTFQLYDMDNSAQARSYFDKLLEFQINSGEWERIHRKVNSQESGLSELFTDCKDVRRLVENWFFPSIEKKLGKDQDRMRKFREIAGKYVIQYDRNRDKIAKRDTILLFADKAGALHKEAALYREDAEKALERLRDIGMYKTALGDLQKEMEEKRDETEKTLVEQKERLQTIDCEEMSYEGHRLEKALEENRADLILLIQEIEGLEEEIARAEKVRHTLETARIFEAYRQEMQDLKEIEEKIRVSGAQEEKLRPERERLGGLLKTYYTARNRHAKAEEDTLKQDEKDCQEKITREKERLKTLETEKEACIRRQGETQGAIEAFGREEGRFNRQYGEEFQRNIFGTYEDGFVAEKEGAFTEDIRKAERSFRDMSEKIERFSKTLSDDRKKVDSETKTLLETEKAVDDIKRHLQMFQDEMAERERIAAYLSYRGDLFAREALLVELEKKIKGLLAIRRDREKQAESLEKEMEKLRTGKVMELPEDIRDAFETEGIPVYTGFEWLKQNGMTAEKNAALVKENPFIPYALIVSEAGIEKLRQMAPEAYTSFPVPIVARESLVATGKKGDGRLISFGNVHFYCLFNERLLDAASLQALLEEMEKKHARFLEDIRRREAECERFYGDKKTLLDQQVTRDVLQEKTLERDSLLKICEDKKIRLRDLEDEMARLTREKEMAEENRSAFERDLYKAEQKMTDYRSFLEAYEKYLARLDEEKDLKRRAGILAEKSRLAEEILEDMQEKVEKIRLRLRDAAGDIKDSLLNLARFHIYKASETLLEDAAAEEAAASYRAVTEAFSEEMQSLENRREKQIHRCGEKENDYTYNMKRYGLKAEDVEKTLYSREAVEMTEERLKDRKARKRVKDYEKNEADKKQAVLKASKEKLLRDVKKMFGREDFLPEDRIPDDRFEERRVLQRFAIRDAENALQDTKDHLSSVRAAFSALSEYDGADDVSEELKERLRGLPPEDMSRQQGILRREYREAEKKTASDRGRVRDRLYMLSGMPEFADETFKRPIGILIEVIDDAEMLMRQLNITLRSFETLMEKLQVDIDLVDRERGELIAQLEDYLFEMHRELDKIDKDSGIMLSERTEKMLKIEIPRWEENEEIYRTEVGSFVDDFTKGGLKVIEDNGNLEEYLSVYLQTRKLFDAACGTDNISIQIRKIEADRSYLIPWREVAKNSGAESFLSSFIVLTALMTYMRQDDTDIFADRWESKVLLMDNPFGQTSAKHILDPLMAMARKTHTQIIALSGLGDEAIYGCFDNIYVLSLISSKLREISYLKGEHLRGEGVKEMVPSHIEVYEQQTLF